MYTAEELIKIAKDGTNKEVTAAYAAVYKRDISRCKACQKTDARVFLTRYARAMQNVNTELSHKLKPEFANLATISGVGKVQPLNHRTIAAIQAAGFGYMLEEIPAPVVEADPIGEPITEEPQGDEQEG